MTAVTSPPRHTGRGIVVYNNHILLMERWRGGLHYFSIPGGGIEAGETPEQAAEREIAEETTVKVSSVREILQMHDGDVQHHIFLCEYLSGEPALPENSEEALHGTENRFRPAWFKLEQLKDLPFLYWQPTKQALLDAIDSGFTNEIAIVSAGPTA